jgi:GH3 auxin-responsive promoter
LKCALVKFIGKGDSTSDLVGEKLNAAHVQLVLARELSKHNLTPHHVALVAQKCGAPHYVLEIVDNSHRADRSQYDSLCHGIDEALRSNPGYRYARQIGQLHSVEVKVLTEEEYEKLQAKTVEAATNSGIRHGDLKPAPLRIEA